MYKINKIMEYRGNNWVIFNSNELTDWERSVLEEVMKAVIGRRSEGNFNNPLRRDILTGGPSLPQYYEKGGKFISKNEMELYEKIDAENQRTELQRKYLDKIG